MNKFNDLISDGTGSPSLMRVATLLIVSTIMVVWAVLSIKAGKMLPIDWSQVAAMTGALGFKALQSFAENPKLAAPVATEPAKAPSGVINSLLLCCFLAFGITACNTPAPTVAYKSESATVTTVEVAMNAWGIYVANQHPPKNQELDVAKAFKEYQQAMAAAIDITAIAAQSSQGTNGVDFSLAVQAANAHASEALTDLVNLIQSFGVKLK